MTNRVLILIDFQNEWIDSQSDCYVGEIPDTIEKVNKLLNFCRNRNYKIIFTRHIEKGSEGEFKENSSNVQIINSIKKDSRDIIIEKNKISPFYKTDLEKELKGVEEVVVCGILTNLCVRSFVQDAYDRDFNLTVIKDCCVALDIEIQNFTFKDLKETRDEIKFQYLNEFVNNDQA